MRLAFPAGGIRALHRARPDRGRRTRVAMTTRRDRKSPTGEERARAGGAAGTRAGPSPAASRRFPWRNPDSEVLRGLWARRARAGPCGEPAAAAPSPRASPAPAPPAQTPAVGPRPRFPEASGTERTGRRGAGAWGKGGARGAPPAACAGPSRPLHPRPGLLRKGAGGEAGTPWRPRGPPGGAPGRPPRRPRSAAPAVRTCDNPRSWFRSGTGSSAERSPVGACLVFPRD